VAKELAEFRPLGRLLVSLKLMVGVGTSTFASATLATINHHPVKLDPHKCAHAESWCSHICTQRSSGLCQAECNSAENNHKLRHMVKAADGVTAADFLATPVPPPLWPPPRPFDADAPC